MKITLGRPRMMIAGLAMALMLMPAALVPLIAQPADAPATTTTPTDIIFLVDPSSDISGLVDGLELHADIYFAFSLEDAQTAGVPKPSEIIQPAPSFWQSLIPALIPSIGVGVGGGRESRSGNPCSPGRRTDRFGGVILPIPIPGSADAPAPTTTPTQAPTPLADKLADEILDDLFKDMKDMKGSFTLLGPILEEPSSSEASYGIWSTYQLEDMGGIFRDYQTFLGEKIAGLRWLMQELDLLIQRRDVQTAGVPTPSR